MTHFPWPRHETSPCPPMRILSERECEAVSGGLIVNPWNELDDFTPARFDWRLWGFDGETGEDIVITATIHNNGGGFCPTDSGWIPNFLENLFDGQKYYFTANAYFKYAMLGDNGTLCLYDNEGNLYGGYHGVSSHDAYVMSLTFTTDATTGQIHVEVGAPGTGVGASSGTSTTGVAITVFLGPVGQ